MQNIIPWWALVAIAIIFILIFIIKFFENDETGNDLSKKVRSQYLYQYKQWFMSKNEHDAFNAILAAVGDKYYVFPQVKLDKIFDWKSNGKNSTYAMRHINQKSVDFLLCDKTYINPRLAIELDDITHEREDRRARDSEVDGIFAIANFPILHIHHSDLTDSSALTRKILSLTLVS